MIFAQIVSDTVEETAEVAKQSISIWELTLQGGPIMIPIALLWVIAIYLFVERWLTINKANEDPDAFMSKVKELVLKGDITGAKMLCAQNSTPVARMIEKGITRIGTPLKTIEASIENVGKIEIFKLEKNLPTLATIAGAAPMIGFLGTVIGMVQAFDDIQKAGDISPNIVAGGMKVALITTVGGLIVGMILQILYNYCVSKIDSLVNNMEDASISLVDILVKHKLVSGK